MFSGVKVELTTLLSLAYLSVLFITTKTMQRKPGKFIQIKSNYFLKKNVTRGKLENNACKLYKHNTSFYTVRA